MRRLIAVLAVVASLVLTLSCAPPPLAVSQSPALTPLATVDTRTGDCIDADLPANPPAEAAYKAQAEVYGNGKDYGFAKLEYLTKAPWFKVTPPEGFRPLREESDRIGAEAIARMNPNGN